MPTICVLDANGCVVDADSRVIHTHSCVFDWEFLTPLPSTNGKRVLDADLCVIHTHFCGFGWVISTSSAFVEL